MGYTSEYAKDMLSEHGGNIKKGGNLKKERELRRRATKATLAGKDKRAKRLAKRANKALVGKQKNKAY